MLKIHNTLSRQIDSLPDPKEGRLNMFVCGPTVYDYIHIGNARTFTVFDAFARYLRYKGYDVDYVQNITDIDDKIIRKATEQNIDPKTFAKQWEEQFIADTTALGITSPRYIRATDHIDDIIKQVQTLIDKGYGYEISDGIYFDLSKFPDYGKLSGRTTTKEDDGVSRIDENPEKRNPGDFCLWKRSKDGEPTWGAPWFAGRPGWHIEDTAITESVFGPQYDIHGGAQDLIFPHHEAEVTQQEAASGKVPFVKYWMHVAFLVNKDAKMSKSLGNFATLNELLKTYPPEVLRFYLLSAHWHSPLDFTEKGLIQAEAATQRLAEFALKLSKMSGSEEISDSLKNTREAFFNSLDDNFNVPEAMGHVFNFIREHNMTVSAGSLSSGSAQEVTTLFKDINAILGIVPGEIQVIPSEIQDLLTQRESARENKDYPMSDQFRKQIASLGYQIDDTPYGPLIKKK